MLNLISRQANWQYAVFGTVVVKNVRVRLSNDAAKSIIIQRPNRVLATGPVSKILSRNLHGGVFEFWLIEFKVGPRVAVVIKPPIEKQELAKTRSLNPFEELLGNNLIGIYVRAIHRSNSSGVCRKFLHWAFSFSFLYSSNSAAVDCLLIIPVSNIDKMTGDSSGGGHCR